MVGMVVRTHIYTNRKRRHYVKEAVMIMVTVGTKMIQWTMQQE